VGLAAAVTWLRDGRGPGLAQARVWRGRSTGSALLERVTDMSVSPTFRTFVLEQLQRTAPGIRARSMFGGVGIYAGDLFFALVDDDNVYFKVDESNRGAFDARGMGPFRPYGEDGEVMHYYQVPADLLEDTDALRPWVEAAIGVARRAKGRRRGRRDT
jgi:DNA transformation protein